MKSDLSIMSNEAGEEVWGLVKKSVEHHINRTRKEIKFIFTTTTNSMAKLSPNGQP